MSVEEIAVMANTSSETVDPPRILRMGIVGIVAGIAVAGSHSATPEL